MSVAELSRPGTLVRARGREWVVLPDSTDELLMVRPVGGLDEETTGILPAVEPVESASFRLPSVEDVGDFTSGWLLREAARLSTRASAGPFRSFGRIAIEPRSYQLVPLMMALKHEVVRLLIADDVGIGKTIEASLIARELYDRGEVRRFAVLCPPHLAEQWQRELSQKFQLDAELVLSSTIQRLERDLPLGVSVFDRHPITVVSTDFIKSQGRADDFVRRCPELVIVDEAHGCTLAGGVGKGRQRRFDLISRIAADVSRHLILVTATPHSGNEEAFRSLLSLLDRGFANLPTDLDTKDREGLRRQLARHLVQRRRADIRHYLEQDTAFPKRLDKEAHYSFSPEYRALFDDLLEFAREYVATSDGGQRRQRVRYWSALALLRCVSSSPAAAAATLRSRAKVDTTDENEDVDAVGHESVLDLTDGDDPVTPDLTPGSELEADDDATRRRLLAFARRAEGISAEQDQKLQGMVRELRGLLSGDFRPVVFCRFVDTAEYLARNLRESLPKKTRVEVVTGTLPPVEREARIAALVADEGSYVLVCTDCLSEGVNLQERFDAVVHYDLAWNPTRHEQREGRVDRFGQPRGEVRVLSYYGKDNPIDGVILDVLIRKHKSIKSDLGVAVAVPGSSEQIAEALFEGALFKEKARGSAQLSFIDDLEPRKDKLHAEWDNARDREKSSRSRFAQHTLQPDEVARELASVRAAIGASQDVSRFLMAILRSGNVPFELRDKSLTVHVSSTTDRSLRQAIGSDEPFLGRFELPVPKGEIHLSRTSTIVEGLAGWVLDQAIDPAAREGRSTAARVGVIVTGAVMEPTTLVVARFRYHLHPAEKGADTMLSEEVVGLARRGPADRPVWLSAEEAEQLLLAQPTRNLVATRMEQQVNLLLGRLSQVQSELSDVAAERAAVQLAAHERVREASRAKRGGRVTIEPVLPVDILGAYQLLPEQP